MPTDHCPRNMIGGQKKVKKINYNSLAHLICETGGDQGLQEDEVVIATRWSLMGHGGKIMTCDKMRKLPIRGSMYDSVVPHTLSLKSFTRLQSLCLVSRFTLE